MTPYNAFVGPNGVGKSAVLSALNVFFGVPTKAVPDPTRISSECYHNGNTADPIRITLRFTNIGDDERAALSDYVRVDKLIICAEAVFDEASNFGDVKQYGLRSGIPALQVFFERWKEKAKIDELKAAIYDARHSLPNFPNLPSKKDDIYQCVRAYENEHIHLHQEIRSRDNFYGFTKGVHKLRPYVTYVYIPAVKDASDEQNESKNTALGELIARLVRNDLSFDEELLSIERDVAERYGKLLTHHKGALDSVSEKLTKNMKTFCPSAASVDVRWAGSDKNFKLLSPAADVRLADGYYSGPVTHFGHGIQRSYLLSVLSLLAEVSNTGNEALLIVACEEPELYQHPPQARHLARALVSLCTGPCQVLVTTHSPYFVSGEVFESVRVVRRKAAGAEVKHLTFKTYSDIVSSAKCEKPHGDLSVLTALSQKLDSNLSEIYFSKFVVLVEGQEDIGIVTAALDREGLLDEFYTLGGNIVAANGKGDMVCPITICRGLEIPLFCIFDMDGYGKSENLNGLLLTLYDSDLSAIDDSDDYFGNFIIAWKNNIQTSISKSLPEGAWDNALNEVGKRIGPCAGKLGKNGFALILALNLLRAGEFWPEPLSLAANRIIEFARAG